MSPILIRPVREQIEHDRIIRVLQHRLQRDHNVEVNLGDERRVPVRVGEQVLYPDLVLLGRGSSKKVHGVVEVETAESVNSLEAMAEWAHYGRAKAPFHLYVPVGHVEMARRFIDDHHIAVAQLWGYQSVGDQVHFYQVGGDGESAIVKTVTEPVNQPPAGSGQKEGVQGPSEPSPPPGGEAIGTKAVAPVEPEPAGVPEPPSTAGPPSEEQKPRVTESPRETPRRPVRPAARQPTGARPAKAKAKTGRGGTVARAKTVRRPAARAGKTTSRTVTKSRGTAAGKAAPRKVSARKTATARQVSTRGRAQGPARTKRTQTKGSKPGGPRGRVKHR